MPTYFEEEVVARERVTKTFVLSYEQRRIMRFERMKGWKRIQALRAETAKMQKEFSERFKP